MNDEWEQWPPIEGNDSEVLSSIALIASIIFVISIIVYIFI